MIPMLIHSIHSEFKKIVSKHLTVSLILGLTLFVPLISFALIGVSRSTLIADSSIVDSAMQKPEDMLLLIFRSGNLFCALLGTLMVTTEYGAGAIYRTYSTFRNRIVALFGKLIVLKAFVFLAGMIASISSITILNLSGIESLRIEKPLFLVLCYVLNNLMVALFSYSISLLLSNTVPALVTTFGVLYILPDAIRIILGYFAPQAASLYRYLPSSAASAGIEKTILGNSYSGIDPAVGIVVTAVISLALLFIGFIVQQKKDI